MVACLSKQPPPVCVCWVEGGQARDGGRLRPDVWGTGQLASLSTVTFAMAGKDKLM